jgi:ribosomal protein S18 acetylase RimI-like enzyme
MSLFEVKIELKSIICTKIVMDNLIIRPAQFKDKEAIIRFQSEMAQETEQLTLDENILEKGVTAALSDRNKGFYIVAEIDGEVVASLMITYEWSDWRNGLVWWIQSVYVLPAHRGSKVYSAMYAHIKEMAQRNDSIRGIRLYVDKTNTKAMKVYEKLGMNGEHYGLFEWMKS